MSSSWETYVRELHKHPWTHLYLTSLELETIVREHERNNWNTAFCMPLITVLTISNPTILVCDMDVYKDHNAKNVMNVDPRRVQCPDSVVRKDEEPVNIASFEHSGFCRINVHFFNINLSFESLF